LASTIFHNRDHQACCNQSILFQNYDVESLSGFLNVLFSEEEMSYLQKEQKRKIEQHDKNIVTSKSISLDEYFAKINSKKERSQAMKVEIRPQGCSSFTLDIKIIRYNKI